MKGKREQDEGNKKARDWRARIDLRCGIVVLRANAGQPRGEGKAPKDEAAAKTAADARDFGVERVVPFDGRSRHAKERAESGERRWWSPSGRVGVRERTGSDRDDDGGVVLFVFLQCFQGRLVLNVGHDPTQSFILLLQVVEQLQLRFPLASVKFVMSASLHAPDWMAAMTRSQRMPP
jgi:hypothetical protein